VPDVKKRYYGNLQSFRTVRRTKGAVEKEGIVEFLTTSGRSQVLEV